jgi:hypothetical protein
MNKKQQDFIDSFVFCVGIVSVVAIPALGPWKASSPPPSEYTCLSMLNTDKNNHVRTKRCEHYIEDGTLYFESCKWHVK